MPRPKRSRAALVGMGQPNPYVAGPEAGIPLDPRTTWPSPSTLAAHRLSLGGFQKMYETQQGKCAICACEREPRGLVIDHNHATNRVRGLLCPGCNTGLGLFKDSPDVLDTAIEYLEQRGCYGPDALNGEAS